MFLKVWLPRSLRCLRGHDPETFIIAVRPTFGLMGGFTVSESRTICRRCGEMLEHFKKTD